MKQRSMLAAAGVVFLRRSCHSQLEKSVTCNREPSRSTTRASSYFGRRGRTQIMSRAKPS